MKKSVFLFLFFGLGGVSLAQYVASTVVQNQITRDQAIINSCLDAISTANADMQSIINDNEAQDVTSETPAIAAQVQAIQASQSPSPAQPAPVMSSPAPSGVNWDAIAAEMATGVNWPTALNTLGLNWQTVQAASGVNWTALNLQASGINWSDWPVQEAQGVNWAQWLENGGK